MAKFSHLTSACPTPAQVLLNDQSSRACAYAEEAACLADPHRGQSGWARPGYRLHEFGTLETSHGFTYWPGATLNPAVWDLDAFMASKGSGTLHFDEDDQRFEQSW